MNIVAVKDILTTWIPVILFIIAIIFIIIMVLARRKDNDRLVNFALCGVSASVFLLVVESIITGFCLALEII